jgi:pyruvate dehydrogenase E1 component
MQRMYGEGEGIFYYISVMNENYNQPAMPEGVAAGIVKGAYLLRKGAKGKVRVTLLGSGTILREVLAAADLLDQDFKIPADVYSVTSFSELRREALNVERWNLLNPGEPTRKPFISELMGDIGTPIVAATDYMRSVSDQIRTWLPPHYITLGTDGFGRSDARAELRAHFEVDRRFVALAALKGLADMGQIDRQTVVKAAIKLRIDPAKPNPLNS